MNQEFSFETIPLIPFEIEPELQSGLFEQEGGRMRRGAYGGGSRYAGSRSRPGFRPKGTKRPPLTRPRPAPRGRRRPWGVIREPYGIVSEPYPIEPVAVGSERVRWLQDCLNQALGTQLPVTGTIGPETRSAVRSFQRQQGLRTTGIAGPDTEEALRSVCGNRHAEIETEQEKPPVKVPGLIAWLTWQPSNETSRLYTWDEIQARPFHRIHGDVGVYIVVKFDRVPVGGKHKKIIKKILKVGEATGQSFRERLNQRDHKDIRARYPGRVGYYLAKIQASNACPAAGCAKLIEHLIARTLFRAGKPMRDYHGIPFQSVKGIDTIQVANILPRTLARNLEKAYSAPGPKDVRGQRIGPVIPPSASVPSNLVLPKDTIWEFEEEQPDFYKTHDQMALESPFSEAEEIELAAELLSISSEEELDQFLGKLFKGIGRGLKKAGHFIGKRVLPTLGKGLKTLAKAALPVAGKVLGSFIPITGVGTAIGGAVGSALSKALELEVSGLNAEEAELERARRFVRIAGTAMRQAALASPDIDAEVIVNEAIMSAARKHLPYLHLSESERFGMPDTAQQGRWLRRGDKIVVLGAPTSNMMNLVPSQDFSSGLKEAGMQGEFELESPFSAFDAESGAGELETHRDQKNWYYFDAWLRPRKGNVRRLQEQGPSLMTATNAKNFCQGMCQKFTGPSSGLNGTVVTRCWVWLPQSKKWSPCKRTSMSGTGSFSCGVFCSDETPEL